MEGGPAWRKWSTSTSKRRTRWCMLMPTCSTDPPTTRAASSRSTSTWRSVVRRRSLKLKWADDNSEAEVDCKLNMYEQEHSSSINWAVLKFCLSHAHAYLIKHSSNSLPRILHFHDNRNGNANNVNGLLIHVKKQAGYDTFCALSRWENYTFQFFIVIQNTFIT